MEPDPGYHLNEHGEIIPHAVTELPLDPKPITDEILEALKL
jgi:hypothetical protein